MWFFPVKAKKDVQEIKTGVYVLKLCCWRLCLAAAPPKLPATSPPQGLPSFTPSIHQTPPAPSILMNKALNYHWVVHLQLSLCMLLSGVHLTSYTPWMSPSLHWVASCKSPDWCESCTLPSCTAKRYLLPPHTGECRTACLVQSCIRLSCHALYSHSLYSQWVTPGLSLCLFSTRGQWCYHCRHHNPRPAAGHLGECTLFPLQKGKDLWPIWQARPVSATVMSEGEDGVI